LRALQLTVLAFALRVKYVVYFIDPIELWSEMQNRNAVVFPNIGADEYFDHWGGRVTRILTAIPTACEAT